MENIPLAFFRLGTTDKFLETKPNLTNPQSRLIVAKQDKTYYQKK